MAHTQEINAINNAATPDELELLTMRAAMRLDIMLDPLETFEEAASRLAGIKSNINELVSLLGLAQERMLAIEDEFPTP